MFTGIISDTTTVKNSASNKDGLLLTLSKPKSWVDLEPGESISTDGVCLTVATIRDHEYECHLIPETLAKSTFSVNVPAIVNLERALKAGDRLSGHFVQGHVDAMGTVTNITKAEGWDIFIEFSEEFETLVVSKGSITINGVALTVSGLEKNTLRVSIVPYTLEQTTLGQLKKGDRVNLEFDILGKYIQKAVKGAPGHASR